MLVSEVRNLLTSRRRMPSGSVGRSALISRTTSSYFLSGSVDQSNSTWMIASPSSARLLISSRSSSRLIASSMGRITSFSISAGSAPGSATLMMAKGPFMSGSSARGIVLKALRPIAASIAKTTRVNCQLRTAKPEMLLRIMAAPPRARRSPRGRPSGRSRCGSSRRRADRARPRSPRGRLRRGPVRRSPLPETRPMPIRFCVAVIVFSSTR